MYFCGGVRALIPKPKMLIIFNVHERTNERTNEQTNKRTDKLTNERTKVGRYKLSSQICPSKSKVSSIKEDNRYFQEMEKTNNETDGRMNKVNDW